MVLKKTIDFFIFLSYSYFDDFSNFANATIGEMSLI